MSQLLEVLERLNDTQAAIVRLEGSILKNPSEDALVQNLRNIVRRQDRLQAELAQLADAEFIDLFQYKLIREDALYRFPASSISRAIGDFQNIITQLYDCIKTGPKRRTSWAVQSAEDTAMNFGHVFAGSLGFVFLMPNDRLLAVETELDMAIQEAFRISKAEQSSEILEFSRKYGPGPVRLLYRWAEGHKLANLTADLRWQRKGQDRASLLVQPQEFARLQEIIDLTGETKIETVTVEGLLVGADTTAKTFHLKFQSGDDERGYFDDTFAPSGDLTLDRMYRATIRRQTKVYFSVEKEETASYLLSLVPMTK